LGSRENAEGRRRRSFAERILNSKGSKSSKGMNSKKKKKKKKKKKRGQVWRGGSGSGRVAARP
jgi:hypothetical protein